MDKLSEGWGRKKWNSRYFVLEAHWLKYYHDDEKLGVETNIDMKQVQNVTILSEHHSKENVLAVSWIFYIDCYSNSITGGSKLDSIILSLVGIHQSSIFGFGLDHIRV